MIKRFFDPDCIVIGAGVVGCLSALALQRAGITTALLERDEIGMESSWAGAGMLCPMPPWRYPTEVRSLVRDSLPEYLDLIPRLRDQTGIDAELQRSDVLMLSEPADRPDGLDQLAVEIDPVDISELEPGIGHEGRAWRLGPVWQVRNPRLCKALAAALEQSDVNVHTGTPVRRLLLNNGKVSGIELADGNRVQTASVVVAAGAWTDALLEASGLPGLGIEPVRGQILLFNPGRPLIRHILISDSVYLVPRLDGRILVGSSVEWAGFDKSVTESVQQRLHQGAVELLPELADIPLETSWAGLRPGIDGEIPAIGRYPGVDGLYINSGHYRNGLGMAPASARLLVDSVCNQADPAAEKTYQVRPKSLI